MIKLKQILLEFTNSKWKSFDLKTISDKELSNIYDMFLTTYKGNTNKRISSTPDSLKNKYDEVLELDTDLDGSFDCFLIYINSEYGKKISFLGSKNNIVAKSELIKKMLELLKSRDWFIEGGRKIDDVCTKYNVPYITDKNIIQTIIKKKVELVDSGYYLRKAAFGNKVKKRLYGRI